MDSFLLRLCRAKDRPGPSRPTHTTTPPPPEAADAWKAVESLAAALSEAEIEAPRVDLQTAGEIAQRVMNDVTLDAPLLQRFHNLSKIGELPEGVIPHVALLADAGWYARHQQSLAEATNRTAQVPASVLDPAIEAHSRMERIANHFHGDDEEEGALVREASQRRSYQQLANGLVTFADYYKRHHDLVRHDPKWYRDSDEADARAHAKKIRAALSSSETPEYVVWTDRCARVWTLLLRAYGGVHDFGLAMLRATPAEAARRFPSIVAEARAAPAHREKKPVDPAAPVAPAAEAPAKKRSTRKRR